jgi:hypothetical protein
MQTIKFGGPARFSVVFESIVVDPLTAEVTGTAADPSTVTLKLHDPTGLETTYTWAGAQVIRDSIGHFHFDVTLSVSGQWIARWIAGGAIVAVDEFYFRVESSGFASP